MVCAHSWKDDPEDGVCTTCGAPNPAVGRWIPPVLSSGARAPFFSCVIPEGPIAWSRPAQALTGRRYTPEKQRRWSERAAMFFRAANGGLAAKPSAAPCLVAISLVAARPVRLKGRDRQWRSVKPDWDNEAKIVCDALVRGGVLLDDNIIVAARVDQLYAAKGEPPHVGVELYHPGPVPVRGVRHGVA